MVLMKVLVVVYYIKQCTGFEIFEDIVLMICECARRDSRRDKIDQMSSGSAILCRLCCVREIQLFGALRQ